MRKGILKKIAALGLAVATTLSMGVTALAADDVAVNGPKNGHTYEVYQYTRQDRFPHGQSGHCPGPGPGRRRSGTCIQLLRLGPAEGQCTSRTARTAAPAERV